MYLKYLFTLIIISTIWTNSHGQRALDTIYANEHQNVGLFFPNPIQKAVSGHPGFVFTYNREQEEYLGLLQAVPGKPSNLLVITTDGIVYSFHLVYAKTLPKYNHFITTRESIGTLRPNQNNKNLDSKVTDSLTKQQKTYKDHCSHLLEHNTKNLVTERKRGLRLRLESLTYHGDEVYLVLNIKNKSGIDFELGHLAISVINGSKKRRATSQEIPLDIAYFYKKPDIVQTGNHQRLVCVVPKFVLGPKEDLKIQLWEKSGSRTMSLLVPK
ncbi:DUF4138 domain-containing protein [Flagellimonas profundi]|uniref:DUF4138 domain-containing protein n=1 Tax=Flagellimonas profundi TaxID=2915620 RepID=A0ABS3FB39_9FLAO|nr:DUF4138 domain-containing protein [Allomuricauda profundi]MBO0340186.1 DUF4138 domain-containing protein [Allomuricauda profundi]